MGRSPVLSGPAGDGFVDTAPDGCSPASAEVVLCGMLRAVVAGGSPDLIQTLSVVLGVRWPSPEIIHREDPASAFESVTATSPDVIFVCPSHGMRPCLDFIARVRSASRCAIVLLADGVDAIDRVSAFEMGADDCIEPSATPMELIARLNALLRRTRRVLDAPRVCGRVRIDPASGTASVEDRAVMLSPREFRLLQVLSERPDVPVGHAELLAAVWGPEYVTDTDLLRKTIFRLRAKLELHAGCDGPLIVNARGTGYALRDGATPAPVLS